MCRYLWRNRNSSRRNVKFVCRGQAIRQAAPGIYPDPQGGYNPPVFMRHPQPSEVQRGCLRGCLCDRDGMGNKRGQILT